MDPAYYIEAFDDLLWHINEFRIDSPGAEKTLARFIARAIIDECLPATYLADSELMEFLEDSYEH